MITCKCSYYVLRPESAVRGVLDTYRFGDSGSTWLADQDRPVVDITKNIKDAYEIMSTQMRV